MECFDTSSVERAKWFLSLTFDEASVLLSSKASSSNITIYNRARVFVARLLEDGRCLQQYTRLECGRFYVKEFGLQNCSRILRGFLSDGITNDFDIENAHPVFLSYLARGKCPTDELDYYINHRADLLAIGVLKKQDVLRFIYQDKTEVWDNNYASSLQKEIKIIQGVLTNGEAIDKSKNNPMGSFISSLLMKMESEILLHVKVFLNSYGYAISTPIHDGFLLKCTDPEIPSIINLCQLSANTLFPGINVRFVNKIFKDFKDIEKTVPVRLHINEMELLRFNTPKKDVVFDNRTLVSTFYEQQYVPRFDFTTAGSRPIQALRAGMGCGKTTVIRECIDRMQETKNLQRLLKRKDFKPLRVLIICCRITLGYWQMGTFSGFSHYKDRQWKSDKIIVEYESLHNLFDFKDELAPFDLLVIDEPRSLCASMFCIETNKIFFRLNLQAFQILMQNSRRRILTDADLEIDDAIKRVLNYCCNPGDVQVHRYLGGVPGMHRSFVITDNESAWLNKIKMCLVREEKVAVVCRTRRICNVLRLYFSKFVEDIFIKSYSSDTSDKESQDFFNINEVLKNIKLVLFTSKVTVGADVTIPWNNIFVHCDQGGCCARDILQGVGRFRHLENKSVDCFLKDMQFRESTEEERRENFLNDLFLRRKTFKKHGDFLETAIKVNEKGRMTLSPTELFHVFASVKFEVSEFNDFMWDLCTSIVYKGYGCFILPSNPTCDDELKEINKSYKECAKEQSRNASFDVASLQKDKGALLCFIEVGDERVRRQTADLLLKTQLKMAKYLLNYCHPDRPCLNSEEIDFAVNNNSKIYAYASLIRTSNEDLLSMDHTRLLGMDPSKVKCYADIEGKSLYGQTVSMNGALRVLGFDGVLDTRGSVHDGNFKKNVLQICNLLNAFSNFKPLNLRKACSDSSKNIIQRMQRAIDSFIGGKLVFDKSSKYWRISLNEKISVFAQRSIFFEN